MAGLVLVLALALAALSVTDGAEAAPVWIPSTKAIAFPGNYRKIGEVGMAMVGHKVYIAGDGQFNQAMYRYNVKTDKWSTLVGRKTGDHIAVAAVGTSIYMVGGFNGKNGGGLQVIFSLLLPPFLNAIARRIS